VTLEPCSHQGRVPPCAAALIAAGISKLVCAMQDPNPLVAGRGMESLRQAGIEVHFGLLEAQARDLNRGFITRMERGRPWVRSKLAVSADGRTAMALGESKWITGAAARADVHRLRARSSAILTGIGTALSDDPQLDAWCEDVDELQQPLRVLADSKLRLGPEARMIGADGLAWIYHCHGQEDKITKLEEVGARLSRLPELDGHLCLATLLNELGTREINDLLVEAGPVLNGALLAAGLIDELIVYQSSRVMGANARGMFVLDSVATMNENIKLDLAAQRRVGDDLRLTYRTV